MGIIECSPNTRHLSFLVPNTLKRFHPIHPPNHPINPSIHPTIQPTPSLRHHNPLNLLHNLRRLGGVLRFKIISLTLTGPPNDNAKHLRMATTNLGVGDIGKGNRRGLRAGTDRFIRIHRHDVHVIRVQGEDALVAALRESRQVLARDIVFFEVDSRGDEVLFLGERVQHREVAADTAQPFSAFLGSVDVDEEGALGEALPGEELVRLRGPAPKRRRTRSRSVRVPRASMVRSRGATVVVPETLRV